MISNWWSKRSHITRESTWGFAIAVALWVAVSITVGLIFAPPDPWDEFVSGIVGLACGVIGLVAGWRIEERRAFGPQRRGM